MYNLVEPGYSLPRFPRLWSNDHTSISHLTLLQLLERGLDTLLIHRESLDDWSNLMMSSESQHISVDLSSRHEGTLDLEFLEYDGRVRDLHIFERNGQWVDGSLRSHDIHELMPFWLEGGGDDEVVDGSGNLEFGYALGGDEFRGAEGEGFFFLGVGGGEYYDLTSHLSGELDGQVSESSDTDYTNAFVGLNTTIEGAESVEDGGTPAHERSGVFAGEVLGDLVDVICVPDGVGTHGCLVEVTVTVHDTVGTEGFVSGKTLLAVVAGVVLVAPSNGVTLFDGLDSRSDFLLIC